MVVDKKVSSGQWHLGECHSRQGYGWQEARVPHEEATKLEWHNIKATGFLPINSPQSKELKEVLCVIPCRRQITDATHRSKGSSATHKMSSSQNHLNDRKSVQTADEIVASYSERF